MLSALALLPGPQAAATQPASTSPAPHHTALHSRPSPPWQFAYPETFGSTPATHFVIKYWLAGVGAASATTEVALAAGQFGAKSGGSYPVTLSVPSATLPAALRGRYAVTVAAKSAADTSADSGYSAVFAIGAMLGRAGGRREACLQGGGGRLHTHAAHAPPPCAADPPPSLRCRRPPTGVPPAVPQGPPRCPSPSKWRTAARRSPSRLAGAPRPPPTTACCTALWTATTRAK